MVSFRRKIRKTSYQCAVDIDIAVLTGAERDSYMLTQLKLRSQISEVVGISLEELNELSEKEQTGRMLAAVSGSASLATAFNEQQYWLISCCVFNPETGERVFAHAQEAAHSLDYEQATELADLCAEVNKLKPDSHKEIQGDFFEITRNGHGTHSPAASEEQTSKD